MIRWLALVLGALLVCTAPAWATPTFPQAPNCNGYLASSPTNGNIMGSMWTASSTFVGVTYQDSNGVYYPQRAAGTGGVASAYSTVFDDTVSGSPTNIDSLTGYGANIAGCRFEIAGATLALTTYGQNSSAALVGTTLTITMAGVQANDGLVCIAYDFTGSGDTITTNNGAVTTLPGSGAAQFGAYLNATATASTTFTLNSGIGRNVVMSCADYTATAYVAPAFGLYPNAGVYPGGQP